MRKEWTLLGLLVGTCAAKKPAPPPPPSPGWNVVAEGRCWHPPDWDSLGTTDRRTARSEAIAAVVALGRGDEGSPLRIDMGNLEPLETVLLGYPDKVEAIAGELESLCRGALTGAGVSAYQAWYDGLSDRLNEGVCRRPIVEMAYYLEVRAGWQFRAGVCDTDYVKITVTDVDRFRTSKDAPWVNAAGDLARPNAPAGYPCTTEGCAVGTLLLRFTGKDGSSFVRPIGLGATFDPPSDGVIEIALNDDDPLDNEWFVSKDGIQDRATVIYKPVSR